MTENWHEPEITGKLERISTGLSGEPELCLVPGTELPFAVTAYYSDGSTRDVTAEVKVGHYNHKVVNVSGGRLMALENGTTEMTLTYGDSYGEQELVLHIAVETFPLSVLNPDIYGDGYYNPDAHALVTAQFGFGGWEYKGGIDLSGYSTLMLELEKAQKCGAQLRVYDEASYYTEPACCEIGDLTRLEIDLKELAKKGADGNPVLLDLSHIYRIGFWSFGGSPIVLKSVSLSDGSGDGVSSVCGKEKSLVDVYTLAGVKVRGSVAVGQATEGLLPGIYIVGGRKVAVY